MSENRQDEDLLPAGVILKVLGGVVAAGVALCVIAFLMLKLREHQLRPSRRFPERDLPPPHRVAEIRQEPFEVVPPRPTLIEEQETVLHSYGWVDQSQGLVRIPIDQAMELVAKGVR